MMGRCFPAPALFMLRHFYSAVGLLLLCICFTYAQSSRKISTAVDSSTSADQALKLAESGHCAEALSSLKKVMPHVTDREVKLRARLATLKCAMTLDQRGDAMSVLQELGREFPKDPDALYMSTHALSDLATRVASDLARNAPNSPQAHELNAESLELQGKWDEAAKEYQNILQRHPNQPGIHFRLARLLLSRPNPGPTMAADAKNELEQELKHNPDNPPAEYVLGELARQSGQWAEASEHFSRAAKLDPSFGDAFLGMGLSLLSEKKFAEAIPPLESAVKLQPANPGAHYNLAMAYSRTGRKLDAGREFAIHRQLTGDGQNQSHANQPPAPAKPANAPSPEAPPQ
jgi:tetratricopeptide (TPR) repeat protein